MARLIAVLAATLMLHAFPMNAMAAKRVALVIGNAAYQHVPELANPKNDAQAVSKTLRRLGFEVVEGYDLTRFDFEARIRDFSRAIRGAEMALFYYAGHGLQVDGRNYLATVETQLLDEADLEFETVRLDTVMAQMEREPRTNLIFMDACRNNPLSRNLTRSMGTRSASVGRGLAPIESGVGTLIAFSTQPGNVALDGDTGNSPFTAALVDNLETPGEDIAVVLRRVRQQVIEATGGQQVPWSNSSLTGSVILKAAPATKSEPSAGDDTALLSLRQQLEEMRQRLETAEKQLNRSRPKVTPPAKQDESTSLAALEPKQDQESLKAELEPRKSSDQKTAVEGRGDTAQDFETAKRMGSERGWQLFLRKHGAEKHYRDLALAEIGAAGTRNASDSSTIIEGIIGLGINERLAVQQSLNDRGFPAGNPDGVFGPKTRSAIAEFQRSQGLASTGYADVSLLNRLNIPSGTIGDNDFKSSPKAIAYDPSDLERLGESKAIVEAIRCLGNMRLIYAKAKGRTYLAVIPLSGSSSEAQKILAEKCGGFLVTVRSAQENRLIYSLFENDERFFRYNYYDGLTGKKGPLIGLMQDENAREPRGGWNWVSGERSSYRNWMEGQPNDNENRADAVQYYVHKKGRVDLKRTKAIFWDDFPHSSHAFIMELRGG